MSNYYAYLYHDPSTSQHIYVGKGHGKRAYTHLSNAENKALGGRIKKMADIGVAPEIRLYPQDSEQGALDLEMFLISLIGRRDLNKGTLFNHTDGGDGMKNPSEEAKERWKEKNVGRKRTPETCAKISEAKRGKKRTSPTWNKGKTGLQTAWNKGLPSPLKGTTIPQERKDRIAASKLGKKRGPYKKKID